jgi:Ca2+-binding RTX toxin-like protein
VSITSLFLNFSLFEQAGLIIQDATPTATAFSNQFQLGFEIDETTDFQFESVPFTPTGGTIEHTGDITFLVGGDTLLTIGDFSIGFDANRVSDTNSGFFVADTLEDGLGIDILFDVSIPERLIVADNQLTIADADLLLAPELAAILGLDDTVGTDVGDTRINASLTTKTNNFDIIGTDDSETLEGNDVDNLVAGLLGDDTLFGADGDDTLRGDADSRDPGGMVGGDDVISGGDGNDQIGGKGGNDLLSGDRGDDKIWGDAGDDTIMGVTGNDTLTGDDFSGGSGADLFVFGNGDGTDIITDFDVTEDLIGLVEGELTFEDIAIINIDEDAAIQATATGETLAILDGIEPLELIADLFVITPDVSLG